jgi:hypothetical protein
MAFTVKSPGNRDLHSVWRGVGSADIHLSFLRPMEVNATTTGL